MNRNTEIIRSETADTQCLHVQHESGLNIYIMEMPGYHSAFAMFGTKYGSINTRFRLKGEETYAEVPEGIAHFLEHKLFENEDCDAFAQYARTGANANAFTTFDKTVYLFGCSQNFAPSLEILLQFVQSPYFTQETVDKEQGIIAQEIRMNYDEASWMVFFGLLRSMYHAHPVRIDIAGTEESIRRIDADLLYRCYHTFYNLHNMVLSVAGNVKADEVLEICDRLLRPCEDQGLEELYADEPDTVVRHYTETTMPVGTPLFSLGFKLRPRKGRELLRAELTAALLMETLFGASSGFYDDLVRKGLLNSEFEVDGPFSGDGYFMLSCSGESADPETVRDRIFEVLEDAGREGFDRESFERIRRVHYGSRVRSGANMEANASAMLNAWMNGLKPFEDIEVLAEITYEEALRFLREEIDTAQYVLSVVRPEGAETGC